MLRSLLLFCALACVPVTFLEAQSNQCLCKSCDCEELYGSCRCEILRQQAVGQLVEASVGGKVAPDGKTELQCDLPGHLHRKNVSSQGQGCCVFTSIHHAALWQNVPALQEFPAWVQSKNLQGGGYPGNVTERIAAICKDRGVPEPAYLQVEGTDLEVLKLACATGRMPAITYSFAHVPGRYQGQKISHMVSLVHADDNFFAVLDNNYIGEANYEWLTPAEFKEAYTGNNKGWSVILLSSPPPPPPVN